MEEYEQIWRNYEENEGIMKDIWRNMKDIWRNYDGNMKKYEGGGEGDSQFPGLGVPQRKDIKHVNMKE